MGSVAIMVVSFAGYIIAYKTYGRYLVGRIFGIDPQARTPAHATNQLIAALALLVATVWMIVEVIINYRGHMLTRNQGV